MQSESNIKMTDSLERDLIEREAKAMRSVDIGKLAQAGGVRARRLGRGALSLLRGQRKGSKEAEGNYAAG
jgi:hypothetical protein